MKKIVIFCCLSIIFGLSSAASVLALGIGINFNPILRSVHQGEDFSVEVVINGLGSHAAPSLGSFEINVLYDQAILSLDKKDAKTVIFGDQLDLGIFGSIQDTKFANPGSLNIAESSLEDTADLNSMQLDSFVLAIITFETIGSGTSDLFFGFTQLGDASGGEIKDFSKGKASVTVNPVPEPATLILLGAGLAGLAGFGRKRFKRNY